MITGAISDEYTNAPNDGMKLTAYEVKRLVIHNIVPAIAIFVAVFSVIQILLFSDAERYSSPDS